MNDKIKNFLIAYNARNGWSTDDASLHETIRECGKEVYSEIGAAHRWYDEKFVVKEIDGMLIGYDTFHVTGDANWSDMGLEHSLSNVYEVEKKQKTIDYYEKVR